MELSRAADYAVRTMVDLATFASAKRLVTADVARREQIPRAILARIVAHLAQRGLVTSRRGKRGGVSLGRRAENISLLEVVEAIEGPIVLNRCLRSPAECPLCRDCSAHDVWLDAQARLRSFLQEISIAELAGRQLRDPERALPALPPLERASDGA